MVQRTAILITSLALCLGALGTAHAETPATSEGPDLAPGAVAAPGPGRSGRAAAPPAALRMLPGTRAAEARHLSKLDPSDWLARYGDVTVSTNR